MAESTAAPKAARVERKRPENRAGKVATVTSTRDTKTGRIRRTVERADGRTLKLREV